MLRRGARLDSTRRYTLRLGVGVVMLALVVLVSGCVSTATVPQVSNTCTQPTAMADGFFANRAAYFRVSTQPDPLNPSTNWVCYRIKPPNQATETAGRIDVNATTAVDPGVKVTTDLDSRACTATPGNDLPGPHPLEQGELLETPFYLDAYYELAGNPELAWVCVEAGGVKQRVVVEAADGLDDPDVVLNSDPAPGAIQDTTPPPAGKASTSCSTGAYGTATEVVNAHLNGRDVFLYTAQPASNEVHVCARLSGPGAAGGGHLAVKAATSQVVDIQQSSDITPCTNDVVVLTNPAMAIRTSPVGQTPQSICVNNTRYTIVTGPVPPVVSFTPDT